MAHSYSRLTAYTQCPLSYKLQFLDKIHGDDSGPMEIGAAAHEFFDYWVHEMPWISKMHPVGVPEDFLPRKIEEAAAKCFQKEPRDQSNFKDFLEICKTFTKAYKTDPQYPVSISERKTAFDRQWKPCEWFSKDIMFRAKIDRIDEPEIVESSPVGEDHVIRKIRIVDYKTGFAGTMDSFQLDVYAFIASLLYPYLEEVEVEFFYVKSGFKQVKLLRVEDMGITKIQLESLMFRIESDQKFKAKPGARCLSCPVAHACTEKASDLVAISTQVLAEQLGSEIAVLEAQAKAKKRALNAWCKENGTVTTNGLIYGHLPKESFNVDLAPLLEICVKHQIDPSVVLNPDTTALRKAFKKNPQFAQDVSPYVTVETSMSFRSKKAEEDGE